MIRIISSVALYRALRFTLAGVFIVSGMMKLQDPRAFASIIAEYGLLPDGLVGAAAIGLPSVELVLGASLAFDVRFSLEAVTGLLVFFSGVLLFGILRDLNVDCGCFSPGERSGPGALRSALVRDAVLLCVSAYLAFARGTHAVRPG